MIKKQPAALLKRLDYQPTAEKITASANILIILPQRPAIDAAAAGLALYLSLRKQKKRVIIACAQPLTVAYNRLFAVNKVVQEVGSKNLVISFPCREDGLEKVSYNIDNSQFNLVIEQKEDQPPIDSKDVSYSYTGVSGDLVFAVGANRIEDLGNIYQDETSFFASVPVVNINSSASGILYGKLNIFDSQASSISELMAGLIQASQLPIDTDIATNLVAGIESATRSLAYKTSANTFNILSWLIKNGGKRNHLKPPVQPLNQPPAGAYQPAANGQWRGQTPPFGASVAKPAPRPFNSPASASSPPPFISQRQTINKAAVSSGQPAEKQIDEKNNQQAPKPDWFKPKIFKGKTRV